jgi:hypothetical protein
MRDGLIDCYSTCIHVYMHVTLFTPMSYMTLDRKFIEGAVCTLPHLRLCNPSGMQITGFSEIPCMYMQAHSYVQYLWLTCYSTCRHMSLPELTQL